MATNSKQRVTLFINPNLLTHARAQAIVEGITLTALAERALAKYLPEEIVMRKPEIREDFNP
ncbi:MAG: hypothetical protein V1858_05090 [Candidatus Gottesmanbacteria bacterium]